jgi:hypothetical protein
MPAATMEWHAARAVACSHQIRVVDFRHGLVHVDMAV